jgi:hypothetical protein
VQNFIIIIEKKNFPNNGSNIIMMIVKYTNRGMIRKLHKPFQCYYGKVEWGQTNDTKEENNEEINTKIAIDRRGKKRSEHKFNNQKHTPTLWPHFSLPASETLPFCKINFLS